jgi:MFS family permease
MLFRANKIAKSIGLEGKTFYFVLIILASQLVYTVISFRTSLYYPLLQMLHVNNEKFGFLLGLTGIVSTILYVPTGWIINRFNPRYMLSINLIITSMLNILMVVFPSWYLQVAIFIIFGLTTECLLWPSALKAVRSLVDSHHQGTAFGFFEFGRGLMEFTGIICATWLFARLGQRAIGIKYAIIILSLFGILVGVLIFLSFKDKVFKHIFVESNTRQAISDLWVAIRMPLVWLIGLNACGVYTLYLGNIYAIAFLNGVFHISPLVAAIWGALSMSLTRVFLGAVGGIIADKYFKSTVKFMHICFWVAAVVIMLIIVLPKTNSLLVAFFALLALMDIIIFFLRSVYYAPIGELQVKKAITGGAMSLAVFIAQIPMTFIFTLCGYFIDKYKHDQVVAFGFIYSFLLTFAILGIFTSFALMQYKKRLTTVEPILAVELATT